MWRKLPVRYMAPPSAPPPPPPPPLSWLSIPSNTSAGASQQNNGAVPDIQGLDDRPLLRTFESVCEPMDTVGKGAFGTVILAKVKGTNVIVVAKVLRNGIYSNAWEREIEILHTLDHVNVMKLKETMTSGDDLYLICEYIHNDLGGLMRFRWELFTDEAVKSLAKQLFDALVYLHGQHIVHRDIKPANLLVDEHGGLKVADFGLSRYMTDGSSLMTSSVGTLGHMAPELVLGDPRYTQAVDIWSAGVIVVEMLTGVGPFPEQSSTPLNHFKEIINVIDCPSQVRDNLINKSLYALHDLQELDNMPRPEGAFYNRLQDMIPDTVFKHVHSDLAWDFPEKLLIVDPNGRCSAEDGQRHAWLENALPRASNVVNVRGNYSRSSRSDSHVNQGKDADCNLPVGAIAAGSLCAALLGLKKVHNAIDLPSSAPQQHKSEQNPDLRAICNAHEGGIRKNLDSQAYSSTEEGTKDEAPSSPGLNSAAEHAPFTSTTVGVTSIPGNSTTDVTGVSLHAAVHTAASESRPRAGVGRLQVFASFCVDKALDDTSHTSAVSRTGTHHSSSSSHIDAASLLVDLNKLTAAPLDVGSTPEDTPYDAKSCVKADHDYSEAGISDKNSTTPTFNTLVDRKAASFGIGAPLLRGPSNSAAVSFGITSMNSGRDRNAETGLMVTLSKERTADEASAMFKAESVATHGPGSDVDAAALFAIAPSRSAAVSRGIMYPSVREGGQHMQQRGGMASYMKSQEQITGVPDDDNSKRTMKTAVGNSSPLPCDAGETRFLDIASFTCKKQITTSKTKNTGGKINAYAALGEEKSSIYHEPLDKKRGAEDEVPRFGAEDEVPRFTKYAAFEQPTGMDKFEDDCHFAQIEEASEGGSIKSTGAEQLCESDDEESSMDQAGSAESTARADHKKRQKDKQNFLKRGAQLEVHKAPSSLETTTKC